MKASKLREVQTPLKNRYREDPESAVVTARAQGRLVSDVTCLVETWSGEVAAGLHPATGGDGSKACSADMLLEALVACAGVTLSSVATAMGVTLSHAVVQAQGRWDARGTLGVARDAAVGLTDIELSFDLSTDADEGTTEKLIELTERYCVIFQTLKKGPNLELRRG